MFTIGSFAIIFDKQDRVLLCHRRDMDLWNLPGGGMQSGELPNEAVIREALNPANQPVFRRQVGPSSVELIQKLQIQKPDLGQG
jgi:ADP-ribose pyrophosphatase YjhB (NUDIX family)